MEIKTLAKNVIDYAISNWASDIFIFPRADKYQINLRTQKGLIEWQEIENQKAQELISYFKYIGQMDIAEHRRPQVGSVDQMAQKSQVFLRFSTTGDFLNREALVTRIIYENKENNYFYSSQFEQLKNLCYLRGLIITSGPTGSGKTSTMYELARQVGVNKVVMTIEDPVEIYEPRFLQTQINAVAGIKYLDLMKAALRNRPDILIIGEIRDPETAKVAVNAALSGHLVLATVHAKSSLQTISRLQGLGINKSELANSLTAVSYQRLIFNQKLQAPACLFDLAYGSKLTQALNQDERADFVDWQDSLQSLRKEDKISETDFYLFQQG
ncbi:competence type IV pilus ATPase ComGA [Lactobacillus hominis]|uniref:competence type IV pilus ATPase ComGA n=1 Tax=Lactobacillus hominis TaxID=1203033 RepID=UPI0023F3AC43|nr:competence type IV pilus ATPase ComGA [Lactobacillus hominis]